MEGSSNSDGNMLKSHLQPLNDDGGDYSPVASTKKGCESPFSFWDSESETDIPCVVNCHGVPEGSTKSYDELLKKFNENEEKLRVANLKVRRLEEEIMKWKGQVETSDDQVVNVCEELKLKEGELDKQKEVSERENFNWRIEVEKMNTRFDNMRDEMDRELEEWNKFIDEMDTLFKITELGDQLMVADNQLEISKAEIARLKKERESNLFETRQLRDELEMAVEFMAKLESILVSKREHILKLEDMVSMYKAKETNHELEMQKLKAEMLNSQAKFSWEQDALRLHIATLSGLQTELGSKLEDFVSRNNELEDKLKQCEAEKLNIHSIE